VWNDGTSATGGGVSDLFALPDWQLAANVPPGKGGVKGRGIPDVVANASPQAGYRLYIHGRTAVVGGTAAATPLWAGLIARINQGLGRNLGYINPVLYKKVGQPASFATLARETIASTASKATRHALDGVLFRDGEAQTARSC
jgi:kumamolisin